MLKLRTILLHDYIYYILLSITVLITIINILIPRQSIYNENIKSIRAKIISSSITGDKLNLTIKNKEKGKARKLLFCTEGRQAKPQALSKEIS